MSEVLVGSKTLGTYYSAVEGELESGEAVIKSRGQTNNGKAADVAEMVKRSEGADIEDYSTGTASFENEDGETIRVTEQEIVLRN